VEPLQTLFALEEIRKLKARYFRGVDTHDWDLLGEVFGDDIVCDFRGATTPTGADSGASLLREEDQVLRGRAAVLAGLELGLKGVASVHQGFLPEIEIVDEETAIGVWAMSDILVPADATPFRVLRGYGQYHETYRVERGAWRIVACRLTRLRVEIEE
jgi:hypothetical protein